MYLSSHLSTSLNMFFFHVEKYLDIIPNQYDFILVQNGSISAHYKEESWILSAGDVMLLTPGQKTSFQSLSRNFCTCIEFEPDFIDSMIPHGKILACNSAEGRKNDFRELTRILRDISIEFPKKGSENRLFSLIYEFSDCILRNHIRPMDSAESDVVSERIHQIESFIQQNYHRTISLQELADKMYLSPQYLSKFITQHIGISFTQYLCKIRMQHAYSELTNTDHSVTEIAFNNGFSNTSSFNKNFREYYHDSPSAYRSAAKKKKNLHSEFKPENSQTPPLDFHFQEPADRIWIHAKRGVPYMASWFDTINIGSLSTALSANFHDIFSSCQKTLRFRYVRFENIFSRDVIRPLSGTAGFDYTNLNMIFDSFEKLQIRPFIELSYKPQKKDLAGYLNYSPKDSFLPEKEESYCLHLFKDFLRHCINRYGYESVSSWRFELWFRHDDQLRPLESPEEYVQRFMNYRKVLKCLVPECSLGGPGFNTSADKESFIEILEAMKQENIRPDFFSVYIYCHTPEIYPTKGSGDAPYRMMSEDPDAFVNLYHTYRDLVRTGFSPDIPVYITEFNSGLSGNNFISSSVFQAAFICKNVLKLSQETPCIAYWHFMDTKYHLPDVPRKYSTDLGLIESNGIPKPSLFAYVLLSRLNSYLIYSGNDCLMTSNGNNRYQFLICNYVHYNRQYCINYQSPIRLEHTYDVFDDSHTKNIELKIEGLPTGRYEFTRHLLNRENGSLLDIFIKIYQEGAVTSDELYSMMLYLNKGEAEYYKHVVRPKQECCYIEISSDSDFSLNFSMSPNEILLLELVREV